MGERHRPLGAALVAVAVLAAGAGAAAAAQGSDPPATPRTASVEPRVRAVEPRVLGLKSRVETVAVSRGAEVEITVAADVLFAFDRAELLPEAQRQLVGVVARIGEVRPSRVRIAGHTDSVGEEAYNQALSERRAEAVRAFLAGSSAPPPALEVVGFGETQPVAPNEKPDGSDDPAGRQANRRVIITLAP